MKKGTIREISNDNEREFLLVGGFEGDGSSELSAQLSLAERPAPP